MTQKKLAEWCGRYYNCYSVLIDGSLESTGSCPMLCDSISEAVKESDVFEDVTEQSKNIHAQLDYEVRNNDCKLYHVRYDGLDYVISYFNHEGGNN